MKENKLKYLQYLKLQICYSGKVLIVIKVIDISSVMEIKIKAQDKIIHFYKYGTWQSLQ